LEKDPKDITKPERQQGKKQVLATSYNTSPYSYSQEYGVTEEEATRVLTSFYETFPNVFWREAQVRHECFMINSADFEGERVIYNSAGQRRSYQMQTDYSQPREVKRGKKTNSYPGYSWEEHGHLMFWDLCEALGIYGHDAHVLRQVNNDAIQGRANAIMVELCSDFFEYRCKNQKAFDKIKPHNTVHDSIWGRIHKSIVKSGMRLMKKMFTEHYTGWPLRIEAKLGTNGGNMQAWDCDRGEFAKK
jgi:DNA polymerase I-like protein with 3'-5' exonuclease and polymerase domains